MSGEEQWVPGWVKGVRTRYDEVRERWMILGPERILLPTGPGVEIAQKIDGERSVEAIVGELAEEFEADEVAIREDTMAFLEQLKEKGYLQ